MDLVSVIIPVYNRENYISECLDSLLSQTYENFEAIIVDDGSTDKSVAICEEYARRDKRVKLFRSEHLGVSAARNIALEKANGELVFFLDSDDVIHHSLLLALVEGMNVNNVDIAGSSSVNMKYDNLESLADFIENYGTEVKYACVQNDVAINTFFRKTTPISLMGGVMMRRSYIGDTRFSTEFFIGEDFLFVYQNLVKGSAVMYLKPCWYFRRIHKGSASNNYSFDAFRSRFLRRVLVWECEEKAGRTDNVRLQKTDAFGCYVRCLRLNSSSEEVKKMQQTMKEYKRPLFEAFDFKGKIKYILAVYFPRIYKVCIK